MAQTIWKGVIGFGGISVPVKLHSAVQDQDVHFHLLHGKDGARVQQRVINPQTGQVVASEQIRRGYAAKPKQLVVLSDEELASVTAPTSREIEVKHFVPLSALAPRWFERPYYLAPDGDEASYFALAQALGTSERQGIARWVMRKKSYVGVLRSHGDQLLLLTLRFANEMVDASMLQTPEAQTSDPKELKLAVHLLEALAGELDPAAFHDDYRERVLELIESKAKGNVVQLKTWKPKKAPAESLTDALQASLKSLGKGPKKAAPKPPKQERASA